jgi:hypothetical protein
MEAGLIFLSVSLNIVLILFVIRLLKERNDLRIALDKISRIAKDHLPAEKTKKKPPEDKKHVPLYMR